MNQTTKEIGKLGFGLMRLPMLGEEVDLEQTKQMVDRFMAKGFTYFDTAYVYIGGKSEVAAREALVNRYPRESFQLATKLPVWMIKEPADMQKLFNTHLERTGAGYIDYYLLHSLSRNSIAGLDKHDAWGFMRDMKAKGLARNIGFSFHDTADVLEEILAAHPEMEFVQLQINYADWENPRIQSRACYEVARKYNKPVIIMEPIKGGSLAALPPTVQAIFKQAKPDLSVASWAMRYAASLPGVVTVLSGMSTLAQMEDNLSYMAEFRPLDKDERKVIDRAVVELSRIPTVPCTECKYCVEHCPQTINIPEVIGSLNNYKVYENLASSKGHYKWVTNQAGRNGKASDCVACGACEGHCPQHITISEIMAEAGGLFDK